MSKVSPSVSVTDPYGHPIFHDALRFNGGEMHVRLAKDLSGVGPDLVIRADLWSSDALMELFLVTDALRRATHARLHLVAPYLPYARQDRVAVPGEALSVRVVCDLINAQGYASVEVWDPHSDVGPALLNNVRIVPAAAFVSSLVSEKLAYTNLADLTLVAPDAGARKKVMECSGKTLVAMIGADKKRDPRTGEITGTVVHLDLGGNGDFLIVDDICDGGRTFIELAKQLRAITRGHIMLYVTHGIFSQGLSVFDGLVDDIFVANLHPSVDIAKAPNLHVLREITRQ